MIKIDNLSLRYTTDNKPVLNNLTLTIQSQRITTIIGKSGAGKTTLLRCLAGLEKNFQGTFTINNQNIKELTLQEHARLIGIVFQNFNLFPHLTVLENCMQPLLIVERLTSDQARERASKILEEFDMQNYHNSYPTKLSGGQQQRVALARALCLQPKILLLDEPTSALDPENSAILATLLKRLCKTDIALVVVSQDMHFVQLIIDQIYVLDQGFLVAQYNKKEECMTNTQELKKFLIF